MSFGTNGRCKLWGMTDENNANISSNSKDKDGNWATSFSSKYVKLVGEAKKKANSTTIPEKGLDIVLKSFTVDNCYKDKEGQMTYLKSFRVTVFDFDFVDANGNATNPAPASTVDANGFMKIPDGMPEELPFK